MRHLQKAGQQRRQHPGGRAAQQQRQQGDDQAGQRARAALGADNAPRLLLDRNAIKRIAHGEFSFRARFYSP